MANWNIRFLLWGSSTDGSNPGLSTRLQEGWDEGVSLFAEPLHGSFSLLHLDICSSPSPSPQSWGEQVGKLSLLHVFCPCISCLFAYASTTCSSFPSSRKRTCLVLMRATTSQEGKGISACFTSRWLWIKLAGPALHLETPFSSTYKAKSIQCCSKNFARGTRVS